MAEPSFRRVAALAAVVGAVVSGVVAGGVAVLSSGGNHDRAGSSSGSSLATAAVVRTTLATTVQVGGSIGYSGSYTIVAPSGASAQEVALARQAVAEDRQTLSADEHTESAATTADGRATTIAQTNVNSAGASLSSQRAKTRADCAGNGASTPTCAQDAQKVPQDQTQLTQAQQQLTTAESSATLDHAENQGKVASDETKLNSDESSLALLDVTAMDPGTAYTWLPSVGQIIRQGQPVYAVSNQGVPLLYGSIAAYRAFYPGMSDGADVGELTRDLIALGYGGGLASNHYSEATAAAVRSWQRARGVPATGEILLGEVVFEPGPIRVTSVTAAVGSAVGSGGGAGGGTAGGGGGGGGTVLTATGITPIVMVELDVTQEYLVKQGDAVSIVLPNGTSIVGGHVETVGTVATCTGGSGIGAGGGTGGGTAGGSPCSSSAGGAGGANTNSPPTVPVTIRLDRTPPGARLDQAPVNVDITTQRVRNVLAAPVNALLALQGGGYGVDVLSARGTRLVAVNTGLYSGTLVQISGSGLTPGTRVEVPSS